MCGAGLARVREPSQKLIADSDNSCGYAAPYFSSRSPIVVAARSLTANDHSKVPRSSQGDLCESSFKHVWVLLSNIECHQLS